MWSDVDIERHREAGDIRIEPWDEKSLQPASVDLRLGNMFRRNKLPLCGEYNSDRLYTEDRYFDAYAVLDPALNPNDFFTEIIFESESIIVQPQELILAITKEKVSLSDRVVGRLEGKSSLARLGIAVHSTGGFIDPGNQDLNITLEIVNHNRFAIKLHVGMWIAQIAFDDLVSPCRVPYGVGRGSRYFGDSEPVISKVAENLK